MKGFLQAIGVVQKDATSDTASTKKTSVESLEKHPVSVARQSSLISASLENVAAANQSITGTKVDPAVVDNYKTNFSQELQNNPSLAGLFTVLEAANKLARVSDLKVRYQSALDVTGLAAADLFKSADQYLPVLDGLVDAAVHYVVSETNPLIEQCEQNSTALNKERVEVMERLNQIQNQLNDNYSQQQSLILQRDSYKNAITEAGANISKEFNDLHGILKSSIQ